ncbi:hypothetical protein RCOM_0991010 [Ricinus communis]|uniref:Copine C-terminal domain-containing protein n=1 Tax=Ricinus communis TaxID=3988 RepID=B9S4Q2_RICCO|nr:hypothetical protein RCOM_0991010 [Ricinus communis]
MAAYATALQNVALAGPTLFGQVVNTAAQIAGQSLSENNKKYFVLLILTEAYDSFLLATNTAIDDLAEKEKEKDNN